MKDATPAPVCASDTLHVYPAEDPHEPMSPRGYQPGALSWLTRPLEVGSETFPIVHRDVKPAKVQLEAEEDGAHLFGSAYGERPGEGGWCE